MSSEAGGSLSIRVDLLVIGGGTAGSVAAIKAKETLPGYLMGRMRIPRMPVTVMRWRTTPGRS